MCLMDEELRSIVREDESIGWAFVNEGTAEKPKVGPRCSGDRGEGCMTGLGKIRSLRWLCSTLAHLTYRAYISPADASGPDGTEVLYCWGFEAFPFSIMSHCILPV